MKIERIIQIIQASFKILVLKVESLLDLFSTNKFLQLFAISISCILSFVFRLLVVQYSPPPVVDFLRTHEIVKEFLLGKNIYAEELSRKSIWSTQRYGYPPLHLYLSAALYVISILVNESHLTITQYFLFIIDIMVGLLIYKILNNGRFWNSFFGLILWIFNPFVLYNSSHAKYEVIMILFMLLAFAWLDKGKEIEATVFYTISIMIKPIPILMLPLFLYKLKNRIQSIAIGLGIFLILSLPFLITPLTYFQALTFSQIGRGPAGDQGFGIFAQVHTLYSSIISKISMSIILIIIYTKFREYDLYITSFLVYIATVSFFWVLYKQYFVWFIPFLIIVVFKNLRFKKEIDDKSNL
ncbi:glycosyltransferase 87 family protein [Candidatus Borrarchaeum sp.]|uniref:glycosyltransferase 87 family protein n=1 Tax=Candidatus Borrarchaeum sp. TaxID=2846742 RepID=UPI00257ACB74|nr:glycosyltransferase 87 family protein [Candidatus Borrarchaeum sp.]